MNPSVSALIVTQNRAQLLRQAVKSVLDQSYQVTEIIVVDDGSEEDIRSVLDGFMDKRIRYFYTRRLALLPRLRNIALSHATGDFVAFIDSDDLWHSDKIKLCVEAATGSDADIVFTDSQVFDETGIVEPSTCEGMQRADPDIFSEITVRNLSLAFGTNIFFRRHPGVIEFDGSLWAGDHDFVLRMSAFHKAVYIDRVMNYIRRHPGNMSRPMSMNDIICHLEYNRTLDKLLGAGRIGRKLYRRIRAENYARTGHAYYVRGRHRRASAFFAASVSLYPRLNIVKLAIKNLFRRLVPRTAGTAMLF